MRRKIGGRACEGGEHQLRARFRTLTDYAATYLAVLATVIVVAPLVAIFAYLVFKGAVR